MPKNRIVCTCFVLVGLGCQTPAGKSAETEGQKSAAEPAKLAKPAVASGAQRASVGKPAPDFTLPDLDGREVKLSDHKGKIVVLEWFNPECPFVKAAHTKGSLVDQAKKLSAEGVVWLAVNSGAPGKQGAGLEKSRAGKTQFGLEHPVLLDESGAVGKLYGAERTPHLYVIDAQGTLVYRGAVDNSPDGERESPEGGKLVEYAADAVRALSAGTPIAVTETKAYGCSVKYAD